MMNLAWCPHCQESTIHSGGQCTLCLRNNPVFTADKTYNNCILLVSKVGQEDKDFAQELLGRITKVWQAAEEAWVADIYTSEQGLIRDLESVFNDVVWEETDNGIVFSHRVEGE